MLSVSECWGEPISAREGTTLSSKLGETTRSHSQSGDRSAGCAYSVSESGGGEASAGVEIDACIIKSNT